MGIEERWYRCKPLPQNILQGIDHLASFYQEKGVTLAYLLGSLVKGKGHDVDIAVLTEEANPAEIREGLQKRLGTWRLDLVNLNTTPPSVRFEIVRTGKVI